MKENSKNRCDSPSIDSSVNSNKKNLPILNRMLLNKAIEAHNGKQSFKTSQMKNVTFKQQISSNNNVSENDDQNELNKILPSPAKEKDSISSLSYKKQTDQELSWLKKNANFERKNNLKIFNSQNSQTNSELSNKKNGKPQSEIF